MNNSSSFFQVVLIDHCLRRFLSFTVFLGWNAASWIRSSRSHFLGDSDWNRFHFINILTAFRSVVRLGWIGLSRIFIDLVTVRPPVLPDEPSSLFKICGEVDLFLASLNLCFKSRSCLAPLVEHQFSLLISTLILNLLVLVLKPGSFHNLLFDILLGWNVRQVTGLAVKFVNSLINLVLAWFGRCVKCWERFYINSSFLNLELGKLAGHSRARAGSISKPACRHRLNFIDRINAQT